MPTRTRTMPAREDSPKRLAILEAALTLFAESGVNGVAVPDIATRAEVGTGTIYRYFASKEALVNELFRQEKHRIDGYLTIPESRQQSARQIFEAFWQQMLTYARTYPRSFRFLELQDHRPYLDDQSRDLERNVLMMRVKAFRRLQQQGDFRADIRAEVIMAMVWGALVNLVKATQAGHIELSDADAAAARDACWQLCTTSNGRVRNEVDHSPDRNGNGR